MLVWGENEPHVSSRLLGIQVVSFSSRFSPGFMGLGSGVTLVLGDSEQL